MGGSELEVALDAMFVCQKMLGWSERTYYYHREEMLQCGALFQRYEGKPPKLVTKAFPSKVRDWTSIKASKGEIVGGMK